MSEGVHASTWGFQYFAAELTSLWRSASFRGSAANAACSLLEYITQPVLMIITAPFLVLRLGVEQFGIWMLVSAFAGTAGVFHVGLGDATIKYVSSYRGRGDGESIGRIIRGTLALSMFLGGATAFGIYLAAPFCVGHIFKIAPQHAAVAITSIRLGGAVLWAQSISFVFANSLKAFEQYGPPVKIAALVKGGITGAAVALVASGFGVVAIMMATVVGTLVGIFFLAYETRRIVSVSSLLPSFDLHAWREVLHFGFYSWIQNAAGVAFGQADKLLIAAMLGTGPLTYYALCVQIAQQVLGLPSAAFSFLFPHISTKQESGNNQSIKRIYRLAVWANVVSSVALTLPLVFLSRFLLTVWLGADFAEHSYIVLSVLAVAFCVLSVNVAPHFALLGLGKVRFVSLVNVIGGAVTLVCAATLIPALGLVGVAAGKLFYGPLVSMNYVKMARSL